MKHAAFSLLGLALVLSFAVTGCSKKSGEGSALLGSVTGSVAGVKWAAPERWGQGGERPMRVATYTLPPAQGDTEQGECAVSYFGSGQGGDIDMNIDRWVNQFENPSGLQKEPMDVNGLKVTRVKLGGTYLAPGGPMMQSQGKKENFQLLGAIVEAPDGLVFFKLTGPGKTVEAAEKEFHAMLASLSK